MLLHPTVPSEAGANGFDWNFDWNQEYFDPATQLLTCLKGSEQAPEALPLVSGVPVEGELPANSPTLECKGLPHVYVFSGHAGDETLVQLVSHEFDSYLVLYDETWNVVFQDDNGAGNEHAEIHTWLSEDGNYYVVAAESPYSTGQGGRYTLYFDAAGDVPDAIARCGYFHIRTPVALDDPALGGRYEGYLGSWETPLSCHPVYDLYTFRAEAGDEIRLGVRSVEFDAYLTLYDADMQRLAEDDDSAGAKNPLIEATVPATGIYYAEVRSYWESQYGGYLISFANASTPLAATGTQDCRRAWELAAKPLSSGDVITYLPDDPEVPGLGSAGARAGGACTSGIDVYTFSGLEGDEVLIEVYADMGYRTDLSLYDAAWMPIVPDVTGSDGFADIFAVLPASGEYFIVAGATGPDETAGGFTLYLDVGTDLFGRCWSPETVELLPGVPLTQERGLAEVPTYCSGLSDGYVFYGEAGQTVSISMNSDEFDTYLGLYDPSWNILAAYSELDHATVGNPKPGSNLQVTLPATGTYFLEANLVPYWSEYVGTYTLQLDVLEPTDVPDPEVQL